MQAHFFRNQIKEGKCIRPTKKILNLMEKPVICSQI